MDKKLGALLVVFFLLFTLFVSSIIFKGPLSSITRAKEDYAPSPKSSLVFAYPLLVKADGITKSTINVFIRSEKGMPVKNQKIVLSASVGQLNNTELLTDTNGKASTTLTSTITGASDIEVSIGGSVKMTQPLSVTFE